jgi:thiamine-phosphate pyrophosphorylase
MIPRLIAITDRNVADSERTLARFGELGRLAQPGSVMFQLRDVERAARERLAFGRRLQRIAHETGQLLVVNDRIDIAVLLGADGVHLGETGIETADARSLLGPDAVVSRACHDLERLASLEADAILLSPIVEGRKGRPPLGLEALGLARRILDRRPCAPYLVALGGISAENARACRAAGADGIALIGGIFAGASLRELADAAGVGR